MAQTGYTPILIYSSSTAAQAPAVGNLTNSTLGSELAINITDGKLFYKDNANAVQVIAWKVTPTSAGGTGLTSYTAGDLLYYATGTTLTKLGIGSAYQHLGVNAGGTAPEWQASANSVLTAQGDMLYASAANTLARLAKNTTATRYLSNTGSNNNPAWAQVDLTNGVTGTLPVGNGGTGLATLTANRVLYASATNTVGTSANLTFDGTTLQITSGSFNLGAGGANGFISGNTWYGINSGDWVFQAGNASQGFRWNGSSGGVRMYLDNNSNLLLGTTSSPAGSGNFLINNGNVIQGTAAKGFNFTANSAAAGMTSQLLNWYEEGTFTPTIIGTSTAGTGTYNAQGGRYTRIGRVVTFQLYVDWSAHTGTGNMEVAGLPFTSNTTGDLYSAVAIRANNIALTAGYYLQGFILNNSTQIRLGQYPTGGGAQAAVPIDTAGSLIISSQYIV